MCPSCGNFVDQLHERTGWCDVCSLRTGIKIPAQYFSACQSFNCNNSTDGHRFCKSCRTAFWLERNADEIEKLVSTGFTVERSIRILRKRTFRGQCIVCGDSVRITAVFCNRKVRCKAASRRLRYLIYEKYYSRTDALVLVKEEYVA